MNRKLILILVLALTVTCMMAQTNEKAIGIRFGSGGEVSYQHPLGDTNRIELDLGVTPFSFGVNGIYHWVKDLSSWTEGMSWYYGPGATVGFSNSTSLNPLSKLTLGVVGQVGLEYKFEFPLQLTVDYRPTFYLVRPNWIGLGSYGDICLSARYRF